VIQLARGASASFIMTPSRLVPCTLIAATAVICLPMLTLPLGDDQAFYAYTGWRLLQGGVPGLDWWQQTPPGTTCLHALAQLALGYTPLSVRWLDLLWSGATALALAGFVGRVRPSQGLTAGLLWLWFYGTHYDFWHSAQVDGLITLPAALALLFAAGACRDRSHRLWGMAGCLCAQAFMIKYVALGLAIPLAAAAWTVRPAVGSLRSTSAALGSALAGFVLGLLPWLLWLGATGSLAEHVSVHRDIIGYATVGITTPLHALGKLEEGTVWTLSTHAALIALAVLGALHLRTWSASMRALTLGWLLAAALGFAAQLKGYPYHGLPLLGPLSALGALGLSRLAYTPRWLRAAVLVVLVVSQIEAGRTWVARWGDLVELTTTSTTTEDLARRVQPAQWEMGGRIRSSTTDEETIFVWGYASIIYMAAQRHAPTRFMSVGPLIMTWEQSRWRDELLADLEERPPAYFIVGRHALPSVTGEHRDFAVLLEDFPELRKFVRTRYRPRWDSALYQVYRRRD
jgi:4-amino-4-deoxy-L-arabinose transferase-like glycosyltransferase